MRTIGAPPTYLIKQNFEGTGYDNSETWTETGTPNEDYTTTVLDGSQSLGTDSTSANQRADSPTFASTTDCYGFYKFHISSLPASGNNNTFALMNGTTNLLVIQINSSGQIRTTTGSTSSSVTTSGMSAATEYDIRVRYTAGTGANAFASVEWVAADGTFSGSGNQYTSQSNGTSTDGVTKVRLFNDNTLNRVVIYDKIRADDAVIGSNPP